MSAVPKLRFKDDDGSDFPDWEEVALGDLLDYEQPTQYIVESTEYSDIYQTPVLTAGKSFILGYTDENFGVYEKNLPVIIFDDFTTASKFVDFSFKVKSSAMKILKNKRHSDSLKFIYELIRQIGYIADDHKRHWISTFSKFQVQIPSQEEQQKIASFLSSVDKKIDLLRQKKNALELYKKGLMQKIFSQEIRFKQDDGSDFPDWEEVALGDVGYLYGGLTGKSSVDFGSGSKFITYKQVFDNSTVNLDNCQFVQVSNNERQNRVQTGDIIVTTSSETPSEVGFAAIVPDHDGDIYLNSFCFGYRPNIPLVFDMEFSKFLFRSSGYRRAVILLAQGSTRFNISRTGFLRIRLKIPSIPEQKKIASFLSAIDSKIHKTSAQIENMETLKKGLLQQMFV